MKFAFLGYHVEDHWAAMSESEQEAMVEVCFAYDTKLLKDGNLIDDGAALQPSRTAKILRWKNGAVLVTDGPFTEAKEVIGGLALLQADSKEAAIELVRQFILAAGDGECELRQLFEADQTAQPQTAAKS